MRARSRREKQRGIGAPSVDGPQQRCSLAGGIVDHPAYERAQDQRFPEQLIGGRSRTDAGRCGRAGVQGAFANDVHLLALHGTTRAARAQLDVSGALARALRARGCGEEPGSPAGHLRGDGRGFGDGNRTAPANRDRDHTLLAERGVQAAVHAGRDDPRRPVDQTLAHGFHDGLRVPGREPARFFDGHPVGIDDDQGGERGSAPQYERREAAAAQGRGPVAGSKAGREPALLQPHGIGVGVAGRDRRRAEGSGREYQRFRVGRLVGKEPKREADAADCVVEDRNGQLRAARLAGRAVEFEQSPRADVRRGSDGGRIGGHHRQRVRSHPERTPVTSGPCKERSILTIPNYSKRLEDDLTLLGLGRVEHVHRNLSVAELYEHALRRGEAVLGAQGQLVAETGQHTGRSPNDKFFVKEPGSETHIDWGKSNKPIAPAVFDALLARVGGYLAGKDVYSLDCYVGADPRYRLPVRVVTEFAWHSLFARDLFIEGATGDDDFSPQFTVIDAPLFTAEPERDGTASSTFILVNFARKLVLIGGTRYAGEIKKSVFTLMNYLMPLRNVLSMHCSANVGENGDVAILFGLSGTGKTTLSADVSRPLIGDDEHGWSADGIFNFEGGCYAKAIKLSQSAEPEIWDASHRFGTVLENVVIDPHTRELDLDSQALTENTRAAYPISYIANIVPSGMAGHPTAIVMLTADAFGVLPPIARLSKAQALYHFLSGYTAKVAGTERGVTEPTATFSTCFGAPFMVHHPTAYANLLGERIDAHDVTCWLVNTGWTGGPYGVGSRMKIAFTRAMVDAAIGGRLAGTPFVKEPFFGLEIPTSVPGVPSDVLNPRGAWADKAAYDAQARKLAGLFSENFARFEAHASPDILAAAIRP